MQAVMVTPSKIPPYVRSALNILHESRVMEKFGMFFVDDLDLDDMERINVNLGVKDGDRIKRDQKAALATRLPKKTVQPRGIQLTESHQTAEYPWGETILWTTLQRLLKDHAVDFLRPFDFYLVEMEFENLHLVESLFCDLTRETWLGIHESFVPAGARPSSTRLKDSMEVWTCQNIVARLCGKCLFLPSAYGLEGPLKSKGSDDLSFKALRPLFFPAPGQILKENTIWEGYSAENGYIGRYWEILEKFKDDGDTVDALHEGIDKVFEQLQCLPQSKANSNLWHATSGSVCFLTNPHYYRIKAVSTTARKLNIGPQRPQVSAAELRKRLDPYNPASKKRSRSLNRPKKTTSIKHKKYRKPPKKRQRMDEPLNARANQATTTERRTRGNAQHAMGLSTNSETETTDSISNRDDSNAFEIDSSNSMESSGSGF